MHNNPRTRAAQLNVVGREQAEGASFSLPNPQLYTESPTSEFYTIGVTQPIDFPGVYLKQSKQAKAATALAGTMQVVSELEMKREVHRLYNDAQVRSAEVTVLTELDSAMRSISEAATRQFDAGQVDKVQQLFAATQYGQAHARYQRAIAEKEAALQQLLLITGLRQRMQVEGLDTRAGTPPPQTRIAPTGAALASQAEAARALNEAQWRTERSRAWPGLTVGYLNQGTMDSPTNMRFQAGITLPIWFWQYSARIKSARTDMERAEQEALQVGQQVQSQGIAVLAEVDAASNALSYYTTSGLADADALADAARRFFEQGRSDHITYLRTLNDASTLRLDHLDALRRYQQAIIDLNYLNGTL